VGICACLVAASEPGPSISHCHFAVSICRFGSAFSMPPISIVSILLPTLLAAHGFSKKSLSPSGSLTAFFVGFLMISGSSGGPAGEGLGLKVWAVSLIGFYLLGSRATKCRALFLTFSQR
jgi:uncharacterized membrane protein